MQKRLAAFCRKQQRAQVSVGQLAESSVMRLQHDLNFAVYCVDAARSSKPAKQHGLHGLCSCKTANGFAGKYIYRIISLLALSLVSIFHNLFFMFALSLQEAFRSNCRALGLLAAITYDSWKKQEVLKSHCQVVMM